MAYDWLSAIIIAIVQGLTEWLPISSSGHILLFEKLLGYSGGLDFEVALHFGTLMAVFLYFRKEIIDVARDFFSGEWKTENGRFGVLLALGTIPAAIVGFLVNDYFDSVLSDFILLGMGFLVTGVLLLIVGFTHGSERGKLNWKKSLIIGSAQAVSILPSISRSGATIASGVLLGLDEKKAMKFSFLLSIPAILGASLLQWGNNPFPISFLIPIIVSFLTGLMTIHLCFRYLLTKRKNFRWFGLYAFILGIVLLTLSLVY
ncbi:MAG: undecaprenyl-diphosphate phosphatase [Candidatus Pacearchaeota archaeon]